MAPVATALVHHPVRDRNGAIVTTAITNLDVHDIARSSRTFDVERFYVVSPIAAQRAIVERILDHWREGEGATRLPERGDALERVEPVVSLEEAILDLERRHGRRPVVVATSARPPTDRATVSFATLRASLQASGTPHLLVMGTGHGLADRILAEADLVLEPISGRDGYNHLSVRGATAILLDRLLGR